MKSTLKILFTLFFSSQLCFAAEQKRVEIYVDEDLYVDAEVLAAVQKYVNVIEKNHDFKFDIISFPAALVLDESSLNENSPRFKVNSTAAELKRSIKTSWLDKTKDPLAGVILIGNLPFAEMEFFVRASDGYPALPGDGPVLRYQRWVADLYFMDLDGIWEDRLIGTGCEDGKPCSNLEYGTNGLIDTHYTKDGILGTDEFDIWVSRINPYGEARRQTEYGWIRQLENYDTEYFPEVKMFLLRWLDKSYNQHVKTKPRSDKALYSYSSKATIKEEDFSMGSFIKSLSSLYNQVDVFHGENSKRYMDMITQDYDWVVHQGHSSEKSFENNVSISDFDIPVNVHARVFRFASCSSFRYVSFDGQSYDRSIGLAHLFRTLNGGVAAIGATKTTGGYQDDGYFYSVLKGNYLGDAFLKWANHRTLVFDESRYPQEVYDWFYAHALFGDPFVRVEVDKENVKEDEVPKNIALNAFSDLNISGKCYDKSQGSGGRCNVICSSNKKNYSVGVYDNAEIGSVYTKGGVILEGLSAKNATIYNTYSDALLYINSAMKYDYVSYRNPKSWNKNFEIREKMNSFLGVNCSDVTVASEYTLVDGACIKNLTVLPSATIIIPEGEFFVENVYTKEGSFYSFEKPGYPSILHLKNELIWEGSPVDLISEDNEKWAQGLKLYVYNKMNVNIISSFYGSIYAPNTVINIYGKAYGSFSGYGLTIHKDALVYYVPFDPIGGVPFDDDNTNIVFEDKDIPVLGNAMIQITAFNRSAFEYNVTEGGLYKFTVMNVLSQKIASFDVDAKPGHNSINFTSLRLASGRYFLSVKRGNDIKNIVMNLK